MKTKDEQSKAVVPQKEEQLFEVMNSIAMRFAKEGYVEKALHWLQKAEPSTINNQRYAIIFHNNLACIYKQKQDLPTAISHLKHSESILHSAHSNLPNSNHPRIDRMLIDCWLNMAALHSAQKLHS